MPGPRRRAVVLALLAGLATAGPGCNEGDTVTTPTLAATCSATPASGPAPLVVSFALSISGAQGTPQVTVSYGDGATGTNPDATHTYATEGVYTASFDVTTADQSARCATTVTVSSGAGGGPGPTPTPGPGGNLPPVLDVKTRPFAKNGKITGTAPLTVKLSICDSADPEGDTVYFTMDSDGDGSFDTHGTTGGSCRREPTFSTGTWKPQVCVTDLDPAGARLHDLQCQVLTVVANP
jgi:PKD repeat protein